MSTTIRWRLTLALLVITLAGGLLLLILLALGLADPPYAGAMQWQTTAPEDWPAYSITQQQTCLAAPVTLPRYFTLELAAENAGAPGSAWGVQLQHEDTAMTFLIDHEGYFSAASAQPQWAEFLHIRPGGHNRLYLHSAPNGGLTVRINDEIAWQGALPAQMENLRWCVVYHQQPRLAWEQISLYYEP